MDQDSSTRGFWDSRFAAQKMPWDFNGVPEQVKAYLAHAQPGRVLIPGCGSAYEVAAFHAAGWSVTALDFSPLAVDRAKRILGPIGDLVLLGDFFGHPVEGALFDAVYERTFLCALPPRLWPEYSAKMRRLIRPGGQLIGYFLYGEEPEPPPFPLTKSAAAQLLGCDFLRTRDQPVPDFLPLYAGKERWQEWTHRPA